MICEPEKLDAYIDGELPPADLAALEAHLKACPACSTEALARIQLKQAVRTAAPAYQPSPELRARIAAQIAKPHRPMRLFRNPLLLSAIAAVLLAAIAIPLVLRSNKRQLASAELLDLHVATLASPNPVDVVSSDRHTVKPWFQGKLPFTFNVPELANSPYALLGGKLIYFDHAPAAQLLFSVGQHRISVFILRTPVSNAEGTQTQNGFTTESWNEAGLHYVSISDAAQPDVHALANLIRNAQSH